MSFSAVHNDAAGASAPVNVLQFKPKEPAMEHDIRNSRAFRDLVTMLEYKRPHGSKHERKFINRFIRQLPLNLSEDGYGNLYGTIGDNPSVLWCAHTDTVHTRSGRQRLALSDDGVHLHVADGEYTTCLGADNGAGVWMLREMIFAGVPGLYVFFRNEERGRVGSEYFAKHKAGLLEGIKAAITFDRRGTDSVITHQFTGRCCSDAFGRTLANKLAMGHDLDDGGTYTDTASFVDLIAECTNVSVGFRGEHTVNESLNVPYLFALRSAVLAADFSDLPEDRKPGDNGYDGYTPWWQDQSYDRYANDYHTYTPRKYNPKADAYNDDGAYRSRTTGGTMADLLRDHPEKVAEILESYGLTAAALAQELDEITGYTHDYVSDYGG